MNNNKPLIIIIVLAVVAIGAYLYFGNKNTETVQNPPVTTHPNWQTFTDPIKGVTFMYPPDLGTKYIHTMDWPPQVNILNESFSCTEAGNEIDRAGKTEKVIYGKGVYCVTKLVEGAAGSIYTQYAYAKAMGDKTIILTFTLRAVQCANYDNPQKLECDAEREAFDITKTIDDVFSTLRL